MKRKNNQKHIPIYSVLAFVAGLLITAFIIIADKLAERNVYFYINVRGITPGKMYVIAIWLACLLFITGLNVFLHRNFHSLLLKGAILFCVLLVICYVAFSTLFTALFSMPRSYVSYVSEDGKHEIIIGEEVVQTLKYSVKSYLYEIQDNEEDLMSALLKAAQNLSLSAKAYEA